LITGMKDTANKTQIYGFMYEEVNSHDFMRGPVRPLQGTWESLISSI
jgi:hypothetical protein